MKKCSTESKDKGTEGASQSSGLAITTKTELLINQAFFCCHFLCGWWGGFIGTRHQCSLEVTQMAIDHSNIQLRSWIARTTSVIQWWRCWLLGFSKWRELVSCWVCMLHWWGFRSVRGAVWMVEDGLRVKGEVERFWQVRNMVGKKAWGRACWPKLNETLAAPTWSTMPRSHFNRDELSEGVETTDLRDWNHQLGNPRSGRRIWFFLKVKELGRLDELPSSRLRLVTLGECKPRTKLGP